MSRLPEDLSPESLNDWYARNVGYRPQDDDPTMTDAELRELCLSVAEEHDLACEPLR